MSDWIVRTYDIRDNEVTSFTIRNRTEHEAVNEAMNSPEVQAAAQGEDYDTGTWTINIIQEDAINV